MRFRVLWRQFGSLAVSLESIFRLLAFEEMRQGQPGAGLPFFDVSRRLEDSRGAQELLRLGIIGAHKHEAQVEVRFENVGLGRDRLAIGGYGLVSPVKTVQHKSKIEPRLIIVGI